MVSFVAEFNEWVLLPAFIGIWRLSSYIILKAIPAFFYKEYKKDNKTKYSDEFNKDDITMVVPLYQADEDFEMCLKSWIKNQPHKIILVVDHTSYKEIKELVDNINQGSFFNYVEIEVIDQYAPGKRQALYDGYLKVQTKLILFVDDDVYHPEGFLDNLILPMNALDKNGNNKMIGGVGAKQMGRPKPNKDWNIWDILMDMRLYQRMIEMKATTAIGGGCACISGRTELYRMAVFESCLDFEEYFLNEHFLGKKQLSGDDKCMTRICINSPYYMYHQISQKTCLTTKFEDPPVLFKQILRWSRNTIRSDFKALFIERYVWSKYPFLAIVMFDRFISPITMTLGLIFILLGTITTGNFFILTAGISYIILIRTIKIIPYFTCVEKKRPLKWTIYIPAFIIAQYCGAFMTIWAAFSLNNRKWANREVKVNENNEIVRTGVFADCNYDIIETPRHAEIIIVEPDGQISSESDDGYIL